MKTMKCYSRGYYLLLWGALAKVLWTPELVFEEWVQFFKVKLGLVRKYATPAGSKGAQFVKSRLRQSCGARLLGGGTLLPGSLELCLFTQSFFLLGC